MKIFTIVLTIALGILALLIPTIYDSGICNAIFFFLLVTFGLVHGTNDLQLHLLHPRLSKMSIFLRLVLYLSLSLVMVLLYLQYSRVAVLIFILLSSFHFGEEQLGGKFDSSVVLGPLIYFAYGGTILMLLLYLNLAETNAFLAIAGLGTIDLPLMQGLLLSCFIIQFVMLLSYCALGERSWCFFLRAQAEICLLGFMFFYLPLLAGFAVYFIFWHSLPSLRHQYVLMRKKFSGVRFKKVFWQSAVVYLMTIVGLGLIFILVKDPTLRLKVLAAATIAITTPHILSITAAYMDK